MATVVCDRCGTKTDNEVVCVEHLEEAEDKIKDLEKEIADLNTTIAELDRENEKLQEGK